MNWEGLAEKMRRLFELAPTIVSILLGIVLVAQGIYNILLDFKVEAPALYYVAHMIMTVGGVLIILLYKKDLVRLTGIYAITLGSSRILIRYLGLTSDSSTAIIVASAALMLLAANLVFTGISFARGNVIRRTSMIITAGILAATNMIVLAVLSVLGAFDEDPSGILGYLLNFLMYMILVGMLDMEIVRMNTSDGKHATHLDRIRCSYTLDSDSTVSQEVSEQLLSRSGPLWKEVNDDVVQSEMVFGIKGRFLNSTVTAQVWKGKEPLYLTITQKNGSVIYANRIKVDEIIRNGNRICFFGRDGTKFYLVVQGGVQ